MGLFEWLSVASVALLAGLVSSALETISGILESIITMRREQELKNQAMIGYIQALQARVEGKPIDPESLNTNRQN